RFSDKDRAVVAFVRYFRQGLRERDRGLYRRAQVHRSGPVYRGNTAWNLSGNDRPDRIVAHTGRLPHGPGSARLQQTRMASKMIASIYYMLAGVNPAALPGLRIAATFFFLIYLAGG